MTREELFSGGSRVIISLGGILFCLSIVSFGGLMLYVAATIFLFSVVFLIRGFALVNKSVIPLKRRRE